MIALFSQAFAFCGFKNWCRGSGLVALVLSAVYFSGCISAPLKDSTAQLNEKVLTQEMAEARRTQLKNVSYSLVIDLTEEGPKYLGDQKITFELEKRGDIWIDFQGGEITAAVVNGRPANLARGPVFVRVPKEITVEGKNTVRLKYSQEYSHSGSGFHRFQDPEDQAYYMYTDFEPFDANRWAPFFDQPDIKAPLELSVVAPAEWTVVANTAESRVQEEDGVKTWYFPKTAPISTYIYALMAGPYASWKSQHGKVPMRLFARKSLAKYVPHAEWFKITKQGFDYFEKYFDVAYPFGKYDQILVPEFNSGAMENVGAVTFSERFVRRGGYTRSDRLVFYNVVLHELAHMWFGNLVTMKWWNDLWLNESFATYMASLAQSEATEFKEAWVDFRADKMGAYRQDQMITTHPISGVVKNSNEAFSNFDSITYGKGASVMKELSLYLGADIFRESLQEYFRRHPYQNTTLADFIAAFETRTGQNMKPWFKSWLETSGVDSIAQSFKCEGEQLHIDLTVSENSRPHAFKIASYKNRGGRVVKLAETHVKTPASTKQETTKISVKEQCPDFIFANFDDHGYFKVQLDDTSLAFLENNISRIESAELRMSLWAEIWQMVRDQKLKVARFSSMALNALKAEKDLDVIGYIAEKTVGRGWGAMDSVYYFWPQGTETEKKSYTEMTAKYEKAYGDLLNGASGDRYKLLFDAYLASVNSKAAATRVHALLGKTKDPDYRWRALHVLCRENYAGVEGLLTRELESDKSDVAKKNALSCRAANPDQKSKTSFVQQLTGGELKLNADEVSRIAGSLFPAKQRRALAEYKADIISAIRSTWPKLEESYQRRLAYGLAPTYCDAEANKELENWLKTSGDLPSTIRKPLLERYDDDKRCVGIRQFNN